MSAWCWQQTLYRMASLVAASRRYLDLELEISLCLFCFCFLFFSSVPGSPAHSGVLHSGLSEGGPFCRPIRWLQDRYFSHLQWVMPVC